MVYGGFYKEGLDLVERGMIPSLVFHAFAFASMWRPIESCKFNVCGAILFYHTFELYLFDQMLTECKWGEPHSTADGDQCSWSEHKVSGPTASFSLWITPRISPQQELQRLLNMSFEHICDSTFHTKSFDSSLRALSSALCMWSELFRKNATLGVGSLSKMVLPIDWGADPKVPCSTVY
jgi:hypothetical protein